MSGSYCVITFKSTHHAIGAEKYLKAAGVDMRIIPLPGEISSGCGLAVRLMPEDAETALIVLADRGIEAGETYLVHERRLQKMKDASSKTI